MPLLKVYNRPGYWRALAWACVFLWAGLRGRVFRTIERASIRWEYKYAPAVVKGARVTRPSFHPFLLFAAIMGAQFRMDDTGQFIQLEMWESDNV